MAGRTRRFRMLVAGATASVAILTAACSNPTPTNNNSSGPGSNYPGQHHAATDTTPIDKGPG